MVVWSREKSHTTNPEEVQSPVVARTSNSILLSKGQHRSPNTYKMKVLLRDAYTYEFEGYHEVTPQDEEEPEENTFDFLFLLFMTWISFIF